MSSSIIYMNHLSPSLNSVSNFLVSPSAYQNTHIRGTKGEIVLDTNFTVQTFFSRIDSIKMRSVGHPCTLFQERESCLLYQMYFPLF